MMQDTKAGLVQNCPFCKVPLAENICRKCGVEFKETHTAQKAQQAADSMPTPPTLEEQVLMYKSQIDLLRTSLDAEKKSRGELHKQFIALMLKNIAHSCKDILSHITIEDLLGAYDRAIELNPDDYSVWCNKVDALKILGMPVDAAKAYDAVIDKLLQSDAVKLSGYSTYHLIAGGSNYVQVRPASCNSDESLHYEIWFADKYYKVGLHCETPDTNINLKLGEFFEDKTRALEERLGSKLTIVLHRWDWHDDKRTVVQINARHKYDVFGLDVLVRSIKQLKEFISAVHPFEAEFVEKYLK